MTGICHATLESLYKQYRINKVNKQERDMFENGENNYATTIAELLPEDDNIRAYDPHDIVC